MTREEAMELLEALRAGVRVNEREREALDLLLLAVSVDALNRRRPALGLDEARALLAGEVGDTIGRVLEEALS